jgi:hypothetical protein
VIRFSTRAAAPFLMMDTVVEAIFSELNLDFHVPGIWLHERLAGLIKEMESLQVSTRSQDKTKEQDEPDDTDMQDLVSQSRRPASVSLASRLVPLIAMLKRAHEKGDPVIWETL